MKEFDVCGLGNAIVDIFVEVPDEEFAALGFERGTMRLVDLAEQTGLLDRFTRREPRLVSGGSVANSVIAFSQLGGGGAFIGCVGDDRYGLLYQERVRRSSDIDIGNPVIVDETTGTCVCLITPDAERTMRTCLAVSSHLAARHVDAERIKASRSGCSSRATSSPTRTPGRGPSARPSGSPRRTARSRPDLFGRVRRRRLRRRRSRGAQARPICCSATRSRRVPSPRRRPPAEAFGSSRAWCPSAVVTDGPNGAFVRHGGAEAHVAGVPVRAAGPDRGRRHVRRGVPVRHHARRRRRRKRRGRPTSWR